MPTTHLLARAVVRKNGQLLVVRAKGQSHTFLPGGHHEGGEGMEACLRRELWEELGTRVTVGDYLGAVEHHWMRGGERQYEINHCFVVDAPSLTVGTPPRPREDYLLFDWVSLDALDEVALQPPPLRALLRQNNSTDSWWASTLDSTPVDSEGE